LRPSGLDMIIAAIAAANDCVVVTDNERDFAGIEIISPLSGAPAAGDPRGE